MREAIVVIAAETLFPTRANVAISASVMTPSTTAYSAVVWPRSRARVRIENRVRMFISGVPFRVGERACAWLHITRLGTAALARTSDLRGHRLQEVSATLSPLGDVAAVHDATRDEASLRRFLHGLPGVDQVGA